MIKLDPLAFPLLPTLLDGFPIKPDKTYYVGNGEHFVAAYMKDAIWRHAVSGSVSFGKPLIDIEPRYVLCAHDDSSADASPANDASTSPREGEELGSWDCGNQHLHNQLTLLLVANGQIRDEAAIRAIGGLAYEAGATFCKEMIESLRPSNCEVPF